MTYHPQKLHGGETDDVIINGELATCHTLTSPAPSACITWFTAKKFYMVTLWQQTAFACSVWISIQHQLNGFMTETECVHCAVRTECSYTGLFEMIVGVLTTCHTQYTWDRSICIFLFNRTTLQVFVTYLTGALYVNLLWFYKHQHDNRVRSKLSVACQRWWFEWRFWFILSVPGYLWEEEEHKPDPWRNPIERNHMGLHLENEVARRVASDHPDNHFE